LAFVHATTKVSAVQKPSFFDYKRQPNIELATAKLGWQLKVNFEDGPTETITHFKRVVS
jgi:UDP-glucuronate decarboxylase